MLENIQLLERDLAPARRGCGAFPVSREGREEPPRRPRAGRGSCRPVLEVMGRGTLPAKAGSPPGEVFWAAGRAQQPGFLLAGSLLAEGPAGALLVSPGVSDAALGKGGVGAAGLGWGWMGQLCSAPGLQPWRSTRYEADTPLLSLAVGKLRHRAGM